MKTPIRSSRLLAPYVLLTAIAATGALLITWNATTGRESALVLAFWFVLSLAAESLWLPTPAGKGMVSMSMAANMAVVFALSTPLALSVTGASVFLADLLLHRRSIVKAVFNASQTVLSLAAALAVARWLGMGDTRQGSAVILLHPMAVLSILPVFSACNTVLVSGAIALAGRERLWSAWKANYGHWYQHVSSLTMMLVGMGLLIAIESIGYVSGLAVLLVLLFLRDAYRYRLRHINSRPLA